MFVGKKCKIRLLPSFFGLWPPYCPNCGVEVFVQEDREGKIICAYNTNVYKGPARYVDGWIVWIYKRLFSYPKVQIRQDLIDEIVAREALNKAKPSGE